MFPEERVLVGVINRPKDFELARDAHWYRIPQGKAPKGIDADYIAFFFSRAFKDLNGGIHYYAKRQGVELATRLQLLPDEPDHPHAQQEYHQLQLGELRAKVPPILNPKRRRFAFIYTTWDRFVNATTLEDLYSQADHLVDRIFYALKDAGYHPLRLSALELGYPPHHAQVRVLCEQGEVIASTYGDEGIPIGDNPEQSVASIQQAIDAKGGPKWLPIPLE